MVRSCTEIGLKCNIEKSFFRKTEKEYLGFCVTCDGVKPMDKKIQAIKILCRQLL